MSSPAVGLRELIMGFRATQLVFVAARLGLADHLRLGPRTPEQLADAAGADPDALRRLLHALVALGLFEQAGDGTITATAMGRLLESRGTGSLRSLALMYGEDWLWRAYGRMLYSVRTGRPAFDQVHGEPLFDFLQHDAEAGALFHDAMSGFSSQEVDSILTAYDFPDAGTVVDVGGGHGVLIAAVLRARPGLSGIVFDRPSAANRATQAMEEAGLSGRGRGLGGDFFESVPRGGGVYLLKSVIHDWDDAEALRILRKVRQAMPKHSRLLLIERVIPEDDSLAEGKLFDLNMLVVVGGRERTEEEYRRLCEQAGLTLARTIPTASPVSLMECLPAPVPAGAAAAPAATR